MADARFEQVTKHYDDVIALKNLSLTAGDGEFLVLVGPSGCGKTTALRCMAGLEEPDEGRVFLGEEDITFVEPKDRDISMVFQNYALYPYMTVLENMGFPLKMRKASKDEIRRQVTPVAEMLGIADLLERKPRELSGGQQQRVAVGRAIVRQPSLFLMDEPLSNLDARLRAQTRTELIKLHQQLETTTIYVTHDQVEAMTMGSQIAVMRDGELLQAAAPLEIYRRPRNTFVASFIGSPGMNLIDAGVMRDSGNLSTEFGDLTIPERLRPAIGDRDRVIAGIRPEHLRLESELPDGVAPELRLQVDVVELLGSDIFIYGGSGPLAMRVPADEIVEVGESLNVGFRPELLSLFDAETGERIE